LRFFFSPSRAKNADRQAIGMTSSSGEVHQRFRLVGYRSSPPPTYSSEPRLPVLVDLGDPAQVVHADQARLIAATGKRD
jgi:hypothetical protein